MMTTDNNNYTWGQTIFPKAKKKKNSILIFTVNPLYFLVVKWILIHCDY